MLCSSSPTCHGQEVSDRSELLYVGYYFRVKKTKSKVLGQCFFYMPVLSFYKTGVLKN